MHIMTKVHVSRSILLIKSQKITIIYLPLISDFISIIYSDSALCSSDLKRWFNPKSKGPKCSASAVFLI